MNYLSLLAYSNSYTGYDYSSAVVMTITPAIIFMILFIELLIFSVAYVINSFLLSRIFKKAGVKPWIAWVPFYSMWKLLEIGGQQGFWAILSVIPIINIVSAVFMYIAMYHIGLRLGKSGVWVVLAIFCGVVWMAILAFDSSKWSKKKITA